VAGAIFAGIGDARLRSEAQAALSDLLGENYQSRIGSAGISFAGFRRLAIEVDDASISLVRSRDEVVQLGSVRFGLRLIPLLRGEVALASVRLGDARIELAGLPSGSGGAAAVFDEAGRVDPDAVASATFDALKRLFATFGRRDINRIELQNVEIVLPPATGAGPIRIVEGSLRRREGSLIALAVDLIAGDRQATLSGEAQLDSAGAEVDR